MRHVHEASVPELGLATFLGGWAVMIMASMSPILRGAVHHVHTRSLVARRGRAIAMFLGGYAISWMVIGVVAHALGTALRTTGLEANVLPALALLVALGWQVSPLKQRCLNECHAHPALAPFGIGADLAALRFGLSHGIWCVGTCGVLMLLPTLLPGGHLLTMVAVTTWVAAERMDGPAIPTWHCRYPRTALRVVWHWGRMATRSLAERRRRVAGVAARRVWGRLAGLG
jgi:predicted metal-binding membrane protein